MVRVVLTLDDFGAASAFARAAQQAEDLTDLMDQVGAVLVQGARDRIGDSNESPEGVPWPKSLRSQLGGGPTLLDSGALQRNLTHRAEPRRVLVGSNLIYAGVHQTGARIEAKNAPALGFLLANGTFVTVGAVTIPARPYLGVSEAERETIEVRAGFWAGEPLQ